MDLDQALSLVKEKREGADPIPAFLNQAKEWETKMIRDGVSLERKNKGNSAREKSNTTAAAVRGLVKGPARGPVRGPFTKCSNTYIQRGPKMEPKSSPLIGPRIGPFMGPIKEKTEESKSSSSNDERERKRRKVVEKNVASLASFPLTNTITETIGPQLPPSAIDGKNSMKK